MHECSNYRDFAHYEIQNLVRLISTFGFGRVKSGWVCIKKITHISVNRVKEFIGQLAISKHLVAATRLPPPEEPDIGGKLNEGVSTLIWDLIKVSRERGGL
jgi:hypothetical protein